MYWKKENEMQRKDYIEEGSPVLKIQNIKPFEIILKKMDLRKQWKALSRIS